MHFKNQWFLFFYPIISLTKLFQQIIICDTNQVGSVGTMSIKLAFLIHSAESKRDESEHLTVWSHNYTILREKTRSSGANVAEMLNNLENNSLKRMYSFSVKVIVCLLYSLLIFMVHKACFILLSWSDKTKTKTHTPRPRPRPRQYPS